MEKELDLNNKDTPLNNNKKIGENSINKNDTARSEKDNLKEKSIDINVHLYNNKEYKILNEPNKDVFIYNEKYFFCCTKKVKLYLIVTDEYLFFYKDKKHTKLAKLIKVANIININKRQLNMDDLNVLTIYYKENESDKLISEFKIKCRSKLISDGYHKYLLSTTKPKKFDYSKDNYDSDDSDKEIEYLDTDSSSPKMNIRNVFISLCHLEYILSIRKFQLLFDIYKDIKAKQSEEKIDDD